MDMSGSQGRVKRCNHFAVLTDPRRGEGHSPFLNMITIAVICGADDFVAITQFGYLKLSGQDTTRRSECAQKKGRVALLRDTASMYQQGWRPERVSKSKRLLHSSLI
jgi:hypothetical protein